MVTREFASQTTPPAALHANVTKATGEYRAVRIKYFSQPFSPPPLKVIYGDGNYRLLYIMLAFVLALYWGKSIKHYSSILVEFWGKIIFQLPVLDKIKIKKEIRVNEDPQATFFAISMIS